LSRYTNRDRDDIEKHVGGALTKAQCQELLDHLQMANFSSTLNTTLATFLRSVSEQLYLTKSLRDEIQALRQSAIKVDSQMQMQTIASQTSIALLERQTRSITSTEQRVTSLTRDVRKINSKLDRATQKLNQVRIEQEATTQSLRPEFVNQRDTLDRLATNGPDAPDSGSSALGLASTILISVTTSVTTAAIIGKFWSPPHMTKSAATLSPTNTSNTLSYCCNRPYEDIWICCQCGAENLLYTAPDACPACGCPKT
jgi:hypothetical protein